MADNLSANIRKQIQGLPGSSIDVFGIVRGISQILNADRDSSTAQELVLRALEKRQHFGAVQPALDGLVRQIGLFPYLDPDSLGLTDHLAYEFHRPDNLGDIVFHRVQASIYRQLMEGRNVVLSAPTSFGKSLIIDAVIASGRFQNIAVIVPTIALIDETRRRLFKRFGEEFKLITHPSQTLAVKNIFVLTQERLLDLPGVKSVQFFVIDEFYKLDTSVESDRAILLNQAFYDLKKNGAQFYLLGPNIEAIPDEFGVRFEASFIRTDYATVVTETHRVFASKDERESKLVKLCKKLSGGTLIYCSSPKSARNVAKLLLEEEITRENPALNDAADWMAQEYHPDWILARGVRRRVGVHHGKIPRALGQFVVRAFNDEQLDFLVCTSTLIEGVNTRAKNVVIYDHKLSTKSLDYFTFNNIKGRSGRMFQHFIGDVYIFAEPPLSRLPTVDIPLLNDEGDMPDSLLVHMDEHDVPEMSRSRFQYLNEQEDLEFDTLKENTGLEPQKQIELAKKIASDLSYYQGMLSWTRYPTGPQLRAVCELIWEFFVASNQRRHGASSGKQLAFKLSRYRTNPTILTLIGYELEEQRKKLTETLSPEEVIEDHLDADLAVEEALDFLRYWVAFTAPRYIAALSNIQKSVFSRNRLSYGDYRFFAGQLENGFLPPGIAALDEYGIPVQIGQKLLEVIGDASNIDATLQRLRDADLTEIEFSPFEEAVVSDTRNYI